MDKKKIKEIQFHIQVDDYFGTLATVLDLMRQSIERESMEANRIKRRHPKILKKLKDELVYLQENYKIIKKE